MEFWLHLTTWRPDPVVEPTLDATSGVLDAVWHPLQEVLAKVHPRSGHTPYKTLCKIRPQYTILAPAARAAS